MSKTRHQPKAYLKDVPTLSESIVAQFRDCLHNDLDEAAYLSELKTVCAELRRKKEEYYRRHGIMADNED